MKTTTLTNVKIQMGHNTSKEVSLALWQVIFIYYSKLGGDTTNFIPLLKRITEIEMFLNHDHDKHMMLSVSRKCVIESARRIHEEGLPEWVGTQDMVFHIQKPIESDLPYQISIHS